MKKLILICLFGILTIHPVFAQINSGGWVIECSLFGSPLQDHIAGVLPANPQNGSGYTYNAFMRTYWDSPIEYAKAIVGNYVDVEYWEFGDNYHASLLMIERINLTTIETIDIECISFAQDYYAPAYISTYGSDWSVWNQSDDVAFVSASFPDLISAINAKSSLGVSSAPTATITLSGFFGDESSADILNSLRANHVVELIGANGTTVILVPNTIPGLLIPLEIFGP